MTPSTELENDQAAEKFLFFAYSAHHQADTGNDLGGWLLSLGTEFQRTIGDAQASLMTHLRPRHQEEAKVLKHELEQQGRWANVVTMMNQKIESRVHIYFDRSLVPHPSVN